MAASGHGIVAGVSGGADSVCLLFVLQEYAKRVPCRLAVVHVDHGLRPDAGEDAAFVEQLCGRENIPFFLKKADVKTYAARKKCSEEEAGRILRYQAFREIAVSFGADRIAVAHNGNDLTETMLFHLFRGSGLKGLSGIPPVRDEIIRPLLCLERSEIERYLRERGISYRADSTNLKDDYTRNRIRHYVLPFAEEQVSAGAVAHMCRTAELLRETEDYLDQRTKEAIAGCVKTQNMVTEHVSEAPESREDSGSTAKEAGKKDLQEICDTNVRYSICAESFCQLHIALQKRLLLHLIRQLAPEHKDISAVHVEDVRALFAKEGNPGLNLPFGIRAEKSYGQVLLWREKETPPQALPPLPLRAEIPSGETDQPLIFDLGIFGRMEFSAFFLKKGQKVPRNQYTKWFDYDKMVESPVLRFRQTGDFLSIADGCGDTIRKSLKDYMITEKIPRDRRDKMPLLAEGSHVIWLIGRRISEYYKVNGNTERVLQVKLSGGCLDGGTEEKDG